MPNYCCNNIIIRGSLKEFKEKLKIPFSFNDFITCPFAFNTDNRYNWVIDNWGVKWDVQNNSEINEMNDEYISILCETAWSPPIRWAKNCLKKYKGLSIEIGYCEMGQEYYGVWKDNIDHCIMFEKDDYVYDDDEYILSTRLQNHLDKYSIGMGG